MTKKRLLTSLTAIICALSASASLPADTISSYAVDGKVIKNFDGSILVGKTIVKYEVLDAKNIEKGNVRRMHIIETSDYKPIEPKPLIVVGSKVYDGELSSIAPEKIKAITVFKGSKATDLYGEAAAGGAIVVELKKDGE